MLTIAVRNAREILRDPLSLGFGLGFPLAVLLLLTAIQARVPVPLFALEAITPGITVFGLSFLTLFSATVLAKDRGSSLLQRLYTTPLTPLDFILGYTLPFLPMAAVQCAVCYLAAVLLGLEATVRILLAIALLFPAAALFIALGLLCGSVLSDRQVGGLCGALLTNLTAWLSGSWFDLKLVGGPLERIAYALPFVHAVEMEKAALAGRVGDILPHAWWVLGYAAVLLAAAVGLFLRQMRRP